MALQFAVTSWANMCPGQPAAAQLPEKPGPEMNRAETDVKNARMKAIVTLLKYARAAKATGTVIQINNPIWKTNHFLALDFNFLIFSITNYNKKF